MHEVTIMENILQIAAEHLRAENASRIHRLRLRVGALSGVVPEALQFAFDALKVDTPAASAVLEMDWVPARLRCSTCGREFEAADYVSACPDCGSCQTEVRQGRELDLVSLEVSREE